MDDKKLESKLANFTFPKTGAIPMMTDAKADLTCCEESDDNSCNVDYFGNDKHINSVTSQNVDLEQKVTFTQGRICCIASSGSRILQNFVTFPAAAIRTSASLSRSRRTYAGTRSVLEMYRNDNFS